MKRINLYKEDLIDRENLKLAYDLCKDIDVNDVVHIALTLELQGKLMSVIDEAIKETRVQNHS